jgi:uncharacterized protein (TIGR03435 family)
MLNVVNILLGGFLSAAALEPPAPQAFSVASVKRNVTFSRSPDVNLEDDAGVTYSRTTLARLLMRAYAVRFDQIAGPPWMTKEFYEVSARTPEGATKDQIPAMLQQLLAERFHVKVHREARETRVCELVVAKDGPRLDPAKPEDNVPAGQTAASARLIRIRAKSLAKLADLLTPFAGCPVFDRTGLTGEFNISLEIVPDGVPEDTEAAPPPGTHILPPPPGAQSSLPSALKTLGLRLDSRKLAVEYLVVDNADRIPTEN